MLSRAPLIQTSKRIAIALCCSLSLSACGNTSDTPPSRHQDCGLTADQLGAFITIPAGRFEKGAGAIYPEEAPSLFLHVEPFAIQINEITNAEFSEFVDATGYVTEAEQRYREGRGDAGSAVFTPPGTAATSPRRWTLIPDASWRKPQGAESSITGLELHPVIHVTRKDAQAYAKWAGGRLPSEVEWEYAASLGLPDPADPASGAYDGDRPRANTWQGIFPLADLATDGFDATAPVGCFEANEQGVYDMIGNVWEWTDTPFDTGTHTIKGGSYLCADNFCRRYRPAARHPQETDFSSNHIGFRIVKDLPLKK